MAAVTPYPEDSTAFTEKAFYLEEFRGRTLVLALPGEASITPATSDPIRRVIDDLKSHGTRVVAISGDRSLLEALTGSAPLSISAPGLEGRVWRQLREDPVLGLYAEPGETFAAACRRAAVAMGITKLVWLDEGGGLLREDGGRDSFIDLAELQSLLEGEAIVAGSARHALLSEIKRLLDEGVDAVNLCTPDGLAAELFTYSGSGTLFTRERYIHVRRLGIDDFEAAYDLHRRGVEEGYLVPRGREELDRVLAAGFGAFVEGRHLAGIGALLPYPELRLGEIASLYTLTRFLGEGVGRHLVAFALQFARERGLRQVFACTTQPRVASFFEGLGFEGMGFEDLPEVKRKAYDPERRSQLRCCRRLV